MGVCPVKNNKAWNNLVKVAGGEENAMRTFIAWGNNTPSSIVLAQEVVKAVGFKAKALSQREMAKMFTRIGIHNRSNNTAHYAQYTKVYDNKNNRFTYNFRLTINMYPKQYTLPTKYTEETYTEVSKDSENNPLDVEYHIPTYCDRVANVGGITIINGNEYWWNDTMYPTMEDAVNARNALEYQLTSSGYGKAIKGLDNYLIDFLKKHGITVNKINNFKEKYGVDGIAVADMLHKIVEVSQGKEDSLTLPEEAGHFIIEMLGKDHPLYKAMEKSIKETEEYKQVVKEYSKQYNNNEEKLIKEAMGKLLAKRLHNAYQGQHQSLLDRIINWFKNLFKTAKNDELLDNINAAYDEVARGVLEGYIGLDGRNIVGDELFFELQNPMDMLKKSIRNGIQQFENRASFVARNTQSTEPSDISENYRTYTKIIRDKVAKGDKDIEMLKEAVISLVETMEHAELPEIIGDTIEKEMMYNKEGEIPPSILLTNAFEVTKTYGYVLKELKDAIAEINNSENSSFNDFMLVEDENKDGQSLLQRIDALSFKINAINETTNRLYKKRIKLILEDISVDYIGPDGVKVKFNPDELLNSKVGNMSWVAANVLPYHSMNDEVLKMVWKTITDIYRQSEREAIESSDKLYKLQKKMFEAGHKDMSIFHERDKEGNKSGYLISEFDWGEYNRALDKNRQSILEAINKNRNDDRKYSSFYDIVEEDLSDEEQKLYGNIFKTFPYSKSVDGRWIPAPPRNPKFDELKSMGNEVMDYYNELRNIHNRAKEKLPKLYNKPENKMLLPQIRMDEVQYLDSSDDNLATKLKYLKNKTLEKFKILEDDLGYGDTSGGKIKTPEGDDRKMLPIYYVRKLKDMNELSNDMTSMYAHFSEMAGNFRGLAERLGDLELIQKAFAERYVIKKSKKGDKLVLGATSNEYKAFEDLMNLYIFGKDKMELIVKTPFGNNVNLSKAADATMNYIRKNNLFMKLFTHFSGAIKQNIDFYIDAVSGMYITNESRMWALGEVGKRGKDVLTDSLRKNKLTKIGALLQRSGAEGDIKKIYHRLDLTNPLKRFTSEDFYYGSYEVMGYVPKVAYAMAVYDNYRLYNGKFVSKIQFEELNTGKSKKDINSEWKSLREYSLYNAFEMTNNGLIIRDNYKKYVTNELENEVNAIVQERTKYIEGNLSKFDKSGWNSNFIGQMIMMHRGWMISGFPERFKKGGSNALTHVYEEGFYRTTAKMFFNLFNTEKRKLMFSAAYWNNLQPYQKRNLIKTTKDLAISAALFTIFKIFNDMADEDDDNYWTRFMAYLSTRAFLEQAAFVNLTEIMSMLNSPSAGLSILDNLKSVASIITFNTDPIKYGPYKGVTRFEKGLFKMMPIHNIYELAFPENANKYVKNQIVY